MLSKSEDGIQKVYDMERVQKALQVLQEIRLLDKPYELDLAESLGQLVQPKFADNLKKWPRPIQVYINKELLAYVSLPEEKREPGDPEIIDGFLDTALFDLPDCTEGPQAKLEKAMKALAQELRRYYGLQENDEELPCWWR